MESMESQEAGFPPFPHSLEIPLGFPHSHGLDCGHVSKVNNKRKARKPDLRPFHRKGLVTDVPGPMCNGCSGTLIPQEGLVTLLCAERRKMLCFSGGRCGRERPAEEGAGRRWLPCRLQAGGSLPPFCVASVFCLSGVLRNEAKRED